MDLGSVADCAGGVASTEVEPDLLRSMVKTMVKTMAVGSRPIRSPR